MSYLKKIFTNGMVLNASDMNDLVNDIESRQLLSAMTPPLVSVTDGAYINLSLVNQEITSYCIDKYLVEGLKEITAFGQLGPVAVCTWTTKDDVRTQACVGGNVDNTNSKKTNVSITLQVPADAKYFELSYCNQIPHGVKVLSPSPSMQFAGKKIGIIGDSIAADKPGFFGTLINELNATSSCNAAVGGWGFSELNSEVGLYRQVQHLDDDIDLCIVWAGTNDFGHNQPIGDNYYTETDGEKVPIVNTTTVYGGINKLIEVLHDKYQHIPIVFCTPLYRIAGHTSRQKNDIGLYLDAYIEAIRDVANFYSIPVFNSGAMTGLDPHNNYLNETYFDDGIHPNEAGNEVIGKALAKFINNSLYLAT